MKEPKDLNLLKKEGWYRIPDIKFTPKMVKDKSIDIIAFYQGKVFKDDAFMVKYYAEVKKIEKHKRQDIFPDEPINEKSNNIYFKITIDKLLELEQPIYSRLRRRILFIKSNHEKFFKAKEINDLFFESPIEEKIWKALKANQILAERQYYVNIVKNKGYRLDFAMFCNDINLALECDGDTYHTSKKDVKYDKLRDNELKSKGWNVLRYTSDDINNNTETVISQVKETINNYGGLKDIDNNKRYFESLNNKNQDSLFDKY